MESQRRRMGGLKFRRHTKGRTGTGHSLAWAGQCGRVLALLFTNCFWVPESSPERIFIQRDHGGIWKLEFPLLSLFFSCFCFYFCKAKGHEIIGGSWAFGLSCFVSQRGLETAGFLLVWSPGVRPVAYRHRLYIPIHGSIITCGLSRTQPSHIISLHIVHASYEICIWAQYIPPSLPRGLSFFFLPSFFLGRTNAPTSSE
ncbi:hypothetical protein SODALDRAFT_199491 [Sodiomyces alkalinus F11]|uniref:Uncharacterized protein n=1 Tax=Sodiomyces alkalinus (strain CBS 110278 / VKM F-3762 / F11) TaxID=1314773 RepID=A0A3N2PSQ5_SODAK|nr:hypothetical protein SODALDRAFT_199491 [Sodiomyces alkalinus F11]ROT37542.1 hypothetical protein SODALDRAFT_199491 [Sodiomyces alkalinus F11]